MSYDEFLIRSEGHGYNQIGFAIKIGYHANSVCSWRKNGVPSWVGVILDSWDTIEFQKEAFREFNRRLLEVAVHSAEICAAKGRRP